MPSYDIKESFPIATLIDALARKKEREAALRQQQDQTLLTGIRDFTGSLGGIVKQKQDMARALAIGQEFGIDPQTAGSLSPEQALKVGELTSPQPLITVDPLTGQTISTGTIPRRSRVVASPRSNPQQSQFVDKDGTPLVYDPRTESYKRANIGGNVTPVPRKGDESAVGDAALLTNQVPNIKIMFDAYRNSKNPRLQATPAGRLLNPVGKQAEDSLKLAAFTFGGKNLTGTEKKVVFQALFPSITDNEESRNAKETLLTNYMSGKIDLLEAANLLGPSGSEMRSILEKKTEKPQQPNSTQKTEQPKQKTTEKSDGTERSKFISGAMKKGYSQVEAEELANQYGIK